MREFNLVSAPFASGVAWLVNALLELDVRTTHIGPAYRKDHWLPRGRTEEINPKAYDHLRWHLPALLDRKEFEFEENLEVFWEHRLDFARYVDRPTILFVRDPRDAIYSLYKRDYAEHYTFHQYLSQPATWPYHFPAMFRLPPADTWAYFHLFWLSMQKLMSVKIVTFESTRAHPVEIMEEILHFLGVSRSREQIQTAVERSSFDRARAAMETVEQQTGRRFKTARKGKPGEWRETYDEEALLHFEGPAAYAMELLGYSLTTQAGSNEGDAGPGPLESDAEPDTVEALAEAKRVYRQGDPDRALEMLSEAANSCGDDPLAALAIASGITSLLWTSYVFSRDLAASPPGQLAFDCFYRINQHFGWCETVQDALLQTVSLDNPLVRYTPAIVEQDYRGFSFALWRHRYYAVNLNLKAEELSAAGEEMLKQHEDYQLSFSGESLAQVMTKVDDLALNDQPALVEEGYSGFNIVLYRGKFHGITQSVGPIDIPRVTPVQLHHFSTGRRWVVGDSLAEVKRQIDGLDPRPEPPLKTKRTTAQTGTALATTVLQEADPARWKDHRFGLTPERWARLKGRSFWITGAGTGYGRALSCALAAAGAEVFLTGRRASKLQEAIEEVRFLGIQPQRCHAIEADLTDQVDVLNAFARVRKMCSALDGLVHCAAVPANSGNQAPLLEDPEDDWDRMMAINVKAAWFLTRTAFSLLLRSGSPRVLFLSSEAGWAATPGFGLYNISKAALNSLSHSLAHEAAQAFQGEDIQINTLIPGEARTEMNQGSTRSPYSLASMALILLSHPKGGPNGRFFHQDGRHFGFGHTRPYDRPLI